ncbi:MAG: response regulator, partial [Terriglobia bacterium]
RYTQPQPDQALLLHQLHLPWPSQPPPRLKAQEETAHTVPPTPENVVPTLEIAPLKINGLRFFCPLNCESSAKRNPPLPPPVDPENLTILLAEDNPVNQRLAVRLIEKRGHTVVVAENGREALAALEKQTFDLVLMDVQMPEMDGFEATAAIRKLDDLRGTHLPVIAMTAHAMKGDRERCLAAGMDGYITKPVKASELIQVIEDHAGQLVAAAAGDGSPQPAESG